MAHFLLSFSSLLISAISYLLAQSGCSQITVMIESKLVAGKRREGSWFKHERCLGCGPDKLISLKYNAINGTFCNAFYQRSVDSSEAFWVCVLLFCYIDLYSVVLCCLINWYLHHSQIKLVINWSLRNSQSPRRHLQMSWSCSLKPQNIQFTIIAEKTEHFFFISDKINDLNHKSILKPDAD